MLLLNQYRELLPYTPWFFLARVQLAKTCLKQNLGMCAILNLLLQLISHTLGRKI